MIKKFITLMITAVMFLLPVKAAAAPSPLSKAPSSSAVILNEGSAKVISYKASYTVQDDITLVKSEVIIKNTDPEAPAEFLIGIPAFIDAGKTKVTGLEVYSDGKKQTLATRKNRTKAEDTEISDLPDNWLAWSVKINPAGYKVFDISYKTENQIEANGTRSIYIPLEYLKTWIGTADAPAHIQITADFGPDAAPYVFEPNPSLLPGSYDNGGRLAWQYDSSDIPDYIRMYYRPIKAITAEYIKVQAPGDKKIAGIAEAFLNKSYETVIKNVDDYISDQNDATLRNELLFIKALSCRELSQDNAASALYSQLEGRPMFGDLEGTIKNKIIYDRYNNLTKSSAEETALYEYLSNIKDFVMNNTLFLNWIDNNLSTLTPPPTPEPSPVPAESPVPTEMPGDEADSEDNLVRNVNIGGVDVPVEVFFIGLVAVIILLSLIFKKKKPRRQSYMFR